jgi:general secretion pathway protein D
MKRLFNGQLRSIACALALVPLAILQPVTNADAATREDGFTLAFVDADVRRVADAVLGAMMGVDYSVDPSVTGNVTLRTVQPVAKSALLPLLESALASVDAVVVRQGKSYRVIARKAALGISLPTIASLSPSNAAAEPGDTSVGFVSEVVTLRFANTREMARLLEEFVGKQIVASRNEASNLIVIAGTGEERTAAKQVIARFDIDSLAQMNYEIYRLDNVDAGILVSELRKIFAPPYDIIGSRIRLIPLPRLRSLLAIASDRSDLGRIEPWIRKLDVGTSGTRKLYNYPVQNGRARDLARSLQLVLGQQVSSYSETGSGRVSGALASPQMAALAGSSSTTGSGNSGSASGAGNFPAETTSDAALTTNDSMGAMSSTPGSSSVRIVPNESNNSLLIYADGEEYAFIKDALVELDQPVAQVLIEATLAEVTLGNDFQYGVDFQTITGNLGVTNVSNASGLPGAHFPGLSASLISQSTSAILNAIQSKTNVRVLSAPRLFVLNNQTATLQVGDQVPIVVQQAQGVAAPGAPIVNTVELRDTGVILQVTPRVNQSGVVTLDIAQEVSDVAKTTTSGINSPTIQQRRLTSTVSTRSGQVVALGGLIRETNSQGRSGVPFLSQIPVIGAVFGAHTNNVSRTELIILIKPSVIRSPDDVKGAVDALIDGLDLARPLVEKARAREITLPQPGMVPMRPVP